MVYMVDINTNDPDSTKYSIKFLRENKMIVTKEFLKSRICSRYWINYNLLRGLYK